MGSKQTTTQSNDPYGPAKPLLNQGLADAQQMYNSGGFNITPYQGQIVADRDPLQQMSDAAIPGAVQGGLNGLGAAQGTLMGMMDPSYGGAAFDQVKQNVIADIMPGINSSFAGSGMAGSTLHQQNLASGLSQGLAEVEYGAQQDAQNRAMAAAGMMPGINQAAYGALDFMGNAGADRQAHEQQVIAGNVLQDQQAKTGELAALQDYLNLASGAGSMFGSSTMTQRQSPGLMGIMGLGMQAMPFF